MSACVRPATEQAREALIGIWEVCFGDPEEEITAFFDHFAGHIRSLLLESDGKPAGALHLLDIAELVVGDRALPCPYIYAVGVLPAFRGRGYGRLLSASAARQEPLCALVPANAGLFAFYRSAGFRDCFTLSERVFLRTAHALHPCESARYGILRERFLAQMPHLRFSPPALDYLARICRESGGGLFDCGEAVAAVECVDGMPYIKELLGPDAEALAGAVAERYGVPFCKARVPGGTVPFGMTAGSAAPQGAYFGFAFD